jgi:hypothetical protein
LGNQRAHCRKWCRRRLFRAGEQFLADVDTSRG